VAGSGHPRPGSGGAALRLGSVAAPCRTNLHWAAPIRSNNQAPARQQHNAEQQRNQPPPVPPAGPGPPGLTQHAGEPPPGPPQGTAQASSPRAPRPGRAEIMLPQRAPASGPTIGSSSGPPTGRGRQHGPNQPHHQAQGRTDVGPRVACKARRPSIHPEGQYGPQPSSRIKLAKPDHLPGGGPTQHPDPDPGPERQEINPGRTGSRVPGDRQQLDQQRRPTRAGRCARAPAGKGRMHGKRRARTQLGPIGCGEWPPVRLRRPSGFLVTAPRRPIAQEAVLTRRSSSEWKLIKRQTPPGCSQSGARRATD